MNIKKMNGLNIKVIIGSTRKSRFSEKPARYIFGELQKKNKIDVELLDLRDFPMPFFDSPISPMMSKGIYENRIIQKWGEKINEGDAFIIVSPEYNHGYPAVLKNAMDVIYPEWKKLVPISRNLSIPGDIFFKARNIDSTGFEIFN
jgi:NAD(P)H-dependent FMN reductase